MSFYVEIAASEFFQDVKVLTPSVSDDNRGNIWTSFTHEEVDRLLPEGLDFKHDKFSQSEKNVIRGIHGDHKTWKLVSCIYGEIFQVVVDFRKDSSTYKKYQSFTLKSEKPQSILIPPGMGNGYCVCSNKAIYHYKLAYEGRYLDADKQFTVEWDNLELDIKWPTVEPILSIRDGG